MGGLRNEKRGASVTGYGLIVGLISVIALAAITTSGDNVNALFKTVGDEMGTVVTTGAGSGNPGSASATPTITPEPTPEFHASCNAIHTAESPSQGYTVRTIDPTGGDPFDVMCYFTDSAWGGGGFTVVAAQWQDDPIQWDEGRQADYQPDLLGSPGDSFALTGSDIPSHSHILFGRIGSGSNDNIDLLPFIYSTGEILKTSLTSPQTGNIYHIARAPAGVYSAHEPEGTLLVGDPAHVVWYNTLTIDQVTSPSTANNFTWAFSPQHTNSHNRSYAYRGQISSSNVTGYAWTVMVR